jgi:hypothetical protein
VEGWDRKLKRAEEQLSWKNKEYKELQDSVEGWDMELKEAKEQLSMMDKRGKPPTRKMEFAYNEENRLNGLLKWLQTHSKIGKVTVTASSSSKCDPSVVVNWKPDTQWVSEDTKEPWIQFTFNGFTLNLESYAFKAHNGPSFPTHWRVEGGQNDSWTELSEEHTTTMTQPNATGIFRVRRSSNMFSAIKFTLIGPASNSRNTFCLRAVDFYGTINYTDFSD